MCLYAKKHARRLWNTTVWIIYSARATVSWVLLRSYIGALIVIRGASYICIYRGCITMSAYTWSRTAWRHGVTHMYANDHLSRRRVPRAHNKLCRTQQTIGHPAATTDGKSAHSQMRNDSNRNVTYSEQGGQHTHKAQILVHHWRGDPLSILSLCGKCARLMHMHRQCALSPWLAHEHLAEYIYMDEWKEQPYSKRWVIGIRTIAIDTSNRIKSSMS